MLRDNIIVLFEQMWPMLLICVVILSSTRIVWIIENKKKFILYKEIFILGFTVYIMCLFHAVTFQDVSWSTSNLVPFKEILRYDIGSFKFFKNVIGNMLLFIPFGFFISYFIKVTKTRYIIFLTLLASITIETTQYMIGRVFDVDDIFLNLLGGLAGYYIYALSNDILEKVPRVLKKPLFYNIITIVITLLIVLYLFNIIKIGGI
ncbi:MAG: VanZ family protein [Bacilli bacterium]|nr:VanZ family protein [Bacilli bacterium]MDD4809109.1 VanZ family protein [Bacilli bacterium]